MRPAWALAFAALAIVSQGCALIQDTNRNLYTALASCAEAHREKVRNRQWADAAWQTVCMKEGPDVHSADFALGFKDGFAEYLYRGGNGEPPLVAPQHYRRLRYQNPQGYQLIHDWFDGYRLGAASARDTGARKWITGPSSVEGPCALGHNLATLTPIELSRREAPKARITDVRTADVAVSHRERSGLSHSEEACTSENERPRATTSATITAVRPAPLGE